MKNKHFHDEAFDESTLEKLDMFRKYLREWLPVFIQQEGISTIQVFDFFAGPGCDADEKPGSPLIICEEARDAHPSNKRTIPIRLYFNEIKQDKHTALCEKLSRQKRDLPSHVSIQTEQMAFIDAFEKEWPSMTRKNVANFIWLDQFGTTQITKSVFQRIVSLARTDFLFFIASASVNRFKEHKGIRENVPLTNEDYLRMNATNVHRILAAGYKQNWLPNKERYYIAPFSLRKDSGNVYGLIFGSAHPKGMDKFLRIAWEKAGDAGAGEANFDIDGDGIIPGQLDLFSHTPEHALKPTKKTNFSEELQRAILDGELKTNKDICEYTWEHGMLTEHAREKFQEMVKTGLLPKQKKSRMPISYDAWEKPAIPILFHGGPS